MKEVFQNSGVAFYLGDARDMTEVGPETVDLVIADPPYGIQYISRHRLYPNKIAVPIPGDEEFSEELLRVVLANCYWVMKPDSSIYLFTDWRMQGRVMELLETSGFRVRNAIIWDKQNWTAGDLKGAYAHQYDIVLFAVKGTPKLKCEGRPQDLISVPRVAGADLIHPAQKPVPLLAWFIENSSEEDSLVLDPFAGVASTLEAARLLGRRSVGFEIDRAWWVAGVQRLRQMVLV